MSLRLLYFCGFDHRPLAFASILILFKTSVVMLREFLVAFWLLHLTMRLGLFGFRAGNGEPLRLTEALGQYS